MTERPGDYSHSRISERDPEATSPAVMSDAMLEGLAAAIREICSRAGVAFSVSLIASRAGNTPDTPLGERVHMTGAYGGSVQLVLNGLMASTHNLIEAVASADPAAAFEARRQFAQVLAFGPKAEAEQETEGPNDDG